ncbi:transcription factor HHO5-like [Argentina anserina]|uniref:transcription factor HHO5-like n=1 Tax=Argentina anserina TaxID=57926 RepID=UPI00217654DE|nr:transcription factor HHO5-like [Potentilla anserina]
MELSLDSSNVVFVPKTISDFLSHLSAVKDGATRSSKLHEYMKRLEDEMSKIEVFKRELPLCMVILKDAIERLKEEVMQCEGVGYRAVVIEEFVPMKKKEDENGGVVSEMENNDMKSWMSSAQLWSTNINFDYSKSELKVRNGEDDRSVPENPIEMSKKRSRGGAFVPFKGSYVKEDKEVSEVSSLSLMTPMCEVKNGSSKSITRGGSGPCLVKLQIEAQQLSQHHQQQYFRKQRRCWSPELHHRFVDALQQLGGSQVATPKQIRELMQVDGLTNDEVKSHLQKYRLHVRKVPTSSPAEANGLWMNQDHCEDNSKANASQSGSPQGPLLGMEFAKGGQSTTGGESTETEEDDQKSDGYSWKGARHNSSGDV